LPKSLPFMSTPSRRYINPDSFAPPSCVIVTTSTPSLSSRSASMRVKRTGIGCTMTMGAGKAAGMEAKTSARAKLKWQMSSRREVSGRQRARIARRRGGG